MPEGRIALGIILFLLGIVGVILTRRREARRAE
jgi:NADH:ubiquinone oxidoreductase subunit K